MQHPRTSLYRLLLLIVIGAVLLSVLLVVARSVSHDSENENVPVPFLETQSSLKGSIATIGTTGGRTVSQISFDNFEASHQLPAQNLNIILIPNASDISHGFSLSNALTPNKRIFGYKYSSRNATAEIEAKARADNGEPLSYSELFPGQFFATNEERSDNTFITDFSSQKNIAFLSLADVTLEKNARYVVITRDVQTVFTARGLIDVQTAQDVPGMLSGFVTGNVARTYNTGGSGQVYTTIYYDWTSGGNYLPSNYMSIDESVDHFAEDNQATTGQSTFALLESRNNYGRNSDLHTSVFTFSGVPSNTIAVTNARIRVAGSLFADMPETSRVKLTGTDGTDLTEWTSFPTLGISNAIHTISFSLLPNVSVNYWQNVRMVFENQWASCGEDLCPYKQTMIRLQAIDARFDVQCNRACSYTPPACGNGITEGYLFEVCDDGNLDDRDRCDAECKLTGNWWIAPETNIPAPGIPGPLLRFDDQTMAMGKRFALLSGKVVQLWYSGRATSATTNERLYVSLYEPKSGWGNIVTLNEGLGSVQAYGEQQVWLVIDNQERITIFFNVEGGTYRTMFESGTWSQPSLFSTKAINFADQKIEPDGRGIIVYTKLVPISQDLRSDPFFGAHLSSYQWDDGLFAQKYNNGVWAASVMLQTLYHTTEWQAAVRQNPHANIPRSTPTIDDESDTTYTVRWHNELISVNR